MKNHLSTPLLIIFLCIVSRPILADYGSEISNSDLAVLGRSIAEFRDKRVFDVGAKVKVYLDYSSFALEGFTSNNPFLTQRDLEASVRLTTERWAQLSGANLKISYAGVRNNVSATTNEIVVKAHRYTKFKSGVSSADNTVSNRCTIYFYSKRQDAAGNVIQDIKWNGVFHYQNYPVGAYFMHTIMMHEMGHCFGLGHNNYNINNVPVKKSLLTVMNASEGTNVHYSFGPYIEDIKDMRDMYGIAPNTTLDILRSTNDGVSWSSIPQDLSSVRTISTISPVVNRDESRMMMFYQTPQGRPAYVMGDMNGSTWDPSSNRQFSSENSIYGVSGSGYSNEYMITWVDPNDEHRVKLFYSNNGGNNWVRLGNFNFKAGARPSIRKVSINTWILSYVHLDDNRWADQNGKIYSRISLDDGRTWSSAIELAADKKFRTFNAVTVASKGREDIRIGFIPYSATSSSWISKIANLSASITPGGTLTGSFSTTDLIYGPANSEISIARNDDVWILAHRQPISGKTQSCKKDVANFICYTAVDSFKYLEPALTAKTNSNWVYMFKEK